MKKTALIIVTMLVSVWSMAQQPTVRKVTANGVTFNMVEVKGGRFNMGGTAEQFGCESDEFPIHVVSLNDYYIGETEVTQELWQAVMGDNPSGFQTSTKLPVERVMWSECQDFVSKLTELTGIPFRLPTESEWEFAARGGLNTHFYQYSGSNNIDDVAWWGNCGNTTHEVATKQPNELGLYDMSGNVWEWCNDRYAEKYYSMLVEGTDGTISNPIGPKTGVNRVCRGGGWFFGPTFCRNAFRFNFNPADSSYYIGLRLALDAE